METKSLKQRKRQKKTKPSSESGNNDVLVVPPDILKKLGISIDNSNSDHKNSININTVQKNSTQNNGLTSTISTSNFDKKSSESSCLETANLMKKSVFLSPSFIPTYTNLNSGVFNILNTNENDNSEMNTKNLSYETSSDKNLTLNGTCSCVHNIEEVLETTSKDGWVPVEVSNDKKVLTDLAVPPDDCLKGLVKLSVHKSNSTGNLEEIIDVAKSDNQSSLITDKEKPSSPLHKIGDQKEETDIDNILITQQDKFDVDKDAKSPLENRNKIIQIDKNDENVTEGLIQMNQIINKLDEIDNTFTSLKTAACEIKEDKYAYEINNIVLKRNDNVEEQTKILNNDYAEKKFETEQVTENNFNSIHEIPTQFKQVENNVISLEGKHITSADVESDVICYENKDIDLVEYKSNKGFFKDIVIQNDLALEETNIIALEDNTDQSPIHQKNIVSLEESVLQTEQACMKNKKVSLEDNNLYLKESFVNYGTMKAYTEFQINSPSNISASHIVTSLVKFNEDISQVSDSENIVQIEGPKMKQVKNVNKAEYNENLKEKTETAFNLNSTVATVNVVAPLSKIVHKINIISEEIIPLSDPKELRVSHSPFMKSLTPVPLNSDISPKRYNNNASEITDIAKIIPIIVPSKTEGMVAKMSIENKSNSFSYPEKNELLCITDTSEIISEKQTPDKDFDYLTLVDKGEVKTKFNEDLVTQNDRTCDLVKAECIEQFDASKNCQETDDKHALRINSDEIIYRDSSSYNYLCKEQLKADQETATNKKKPNNALKKITKESYDPSVIGTAAEEFYNNRLDHIVTSDLIKIDWKKDVDATINYQDSLNKRVNSDEIISYRDHSSNDLDKEKLKADQETTTVKNDYKTLLDSLDKNNKKKKEINYRDFPDNANKEFYSNQLDDIVKSTNENSDINAHQDKVKEIAQYIKKYAYVYKADKRDINNSGSSANRNKDTINSKSNMRKSKLCIQGVEKPGGYKRKIEMAGETKILKTYTRQKKNKRPCTTKHIASNDMVSCTIDVPSETELSTVNISMSYRSEDFCLCYDFGRLDASDYDNMYEHIHFWLHNDNNDLDSLLSIYNDDEILYNDRTKLDDVEIIEATEINTKTTNICWSYYLTGQREITNQMQSMNDGLLWDLNTVIASDKQAEKSESLINNYDKIDNIQMAGDTKHRGNIYEIEALKNDIDSNILDAPLENDSNDTYEVITIVEIADIQNRQENSETSGLDCKSASHLTNYEQKDVHGNNSGSNNQSTSKGKTNNRGTSKGKSMQAVKDEASISYPESSKRANRKRSLPVEDASEERCSKKNIKCGVCSKLLPEVEWNHHVAKKHNYIAWKAGQTFNFADPDLLKTLREKLESNGSLKCPNCYIQTGIFNKFIRHIQLCIKQESSSRRESSSEDLIICGVCHQKVQFSSWNEHTGKEHNYLAWIEGKNVLNINDEAAVLRHLQNIIKYYGSLECYKCGLSRKRVKLYLSHIKTCEGSKSQCDESITSDLNSTANSEITVDRSDRIVKCGVCNKEVSAVMWVQHIGKEHQYLAWQLGEKPLNINDEAAVLRHLQNIIKYYGSLECYKCGLSRKRVKLYLSHIKTCEGSKSQCDESITSDLNSTANSEITVDRSDRIVKCGVCNKEVSAVMWVQHIGKEHQYLAWQLGEKPLNINDEAAVLRHLQNIIKYYGSLECYKCGLSRKRVKLYLSHIKTCEGSKSQCDESITSDLNSTANSEVTVDRSDRIDKCGVCNKEVSAVMWVQHIGKEHQYLAWQLGEKPLDLENEEAVKSHLLNISRENCGLVCNMCNVTKKYPKTFQQHVKECTGGTSNYDKSNISDLNSTANSEQIEITIDETKYIVKCGVCDKDVSAVMWVQHIGREHQYLAWQQGQEPLDLENEEAVKSHLLNISRENCGLVCNMCNVTKKCPNTFQQHVKECTGGTSHGDESTTSDLNSTANSERIEITIDVSDKIVKCGVCDKEVSAVMWVQHIGREHQYLAWQQGQNPLDLENEEAIKSHLLNISRENRGLVCNMCNVTKKYPKTFQQHVKECTGGTSHCDESTTSDLNSTANSERIEITIDGSDKIVKCGVCENEVSAVMWVQHIGREHQYLAWQQGQNPLDLENEEAVKSHLLNISRENRGLVCNMCNVTKKYPKTFQQHVKECTGGTSHCDESTTSDLNSTVNSERIEIIIDGSDKIVKCGVCDKEVSAVMWVQHIGREHQYLAWQQGQNPLDLENEEAVKTHLLNITRENNGLVCNLCNVTKKYPKSFQQHVKECTGVINEAYSKLKFEPEISSFGVSDLKADTVICGVCSNVVITAEWMSHMERDHDYLAWLQGRPPLDLNDPDMVQRHLIEVSKVTGGLKCKYCGLVRKYAKTYLHHVYECEKRGLKLNDSVVMRDKDSVMCAVCSATMDPKDWRDHAMKKHYNVAWLVGASPIEINNPYGVEPYIKEYQQRHHNKLVCKTCGVSRVSAVGFYAHIITCGKTEEETEIYKSMCEICNNKYLRIYKSQHMTMHREKELTAERKLLMAKEKELRDEDETPVEIIGRRKAAEKAITVIEKYTSNIADGSNCSKCGFSSDVQSEMLNHICVERQHDGSESDESVNIDSDTEEEDDDDDDHDSDIDSKISDEEREARDEEKGKQKKKHGHRVKRLPYEIHNLYIYMRKSAEEFIALHLTDEDLFSQYRNFDYEIVSDSELASYMPPIEESCMIRYGENYDWVTLKRFEARWEKGKITLFTGACIQNMCWVPPYVGEHDVGLTHEYLSVLSSLASDKPRHTWNEKPATRPALVQIWDCGNLKNERPELVMCLALDCGTIWAIDWCPSGARDVFDQDQACRGSHRLGLFAVASSNGSAYVYAVPHPSTLKEKGQTYKLKPVVELRLTTALNRTVYQATAIKWSPQKGHVHIVVGYADGTTAYFDLKSESPMLRCTENNVEILYPYHDELAQSMCIEAVDVFPSAGARQAGAVAAGSAGGAGTRLLQLHAAAARVLFPPHWPAALLAGDDNLVSQAVTELEWWGGGRRVGGMRALCGCAWCGRVAAASAPLVRLVRAHPAHRELHKQVIATLQMVPLTNKRKRKNDELSMVMEPLTYDEAILKYGIELKQIIAKDKVTQKKLSALPRDTFPERFPLADVTAMAFCPTFKNHHKLAIATHAGVIFIMSV